jgi:hypothetical protein
MPAPPHNPASQPPPKSCTVCGRSITWRKKWERNWDEVRYCSDACRRRAKSSTASAHDQALEAAILALLAERGAGKTICPSEAARRVAAQSGPSAKPAVSSPHDPTAWQALMEPARAAARRLHAAGRIVITQHGHPVDPSHAKGPIRLKSV